MDVKKIKECGINKYNYYNNLITCDEYISLILELPSVRLNSPLAKQLEDIETDYINQIEANLRNDLPEYLKDLTYKYNDIIRKAK